MPRCPTCSRQFGSMRGLRVHHTQTHGVRLPNEKCKFCEKHFHTNNKRRYCSDECRERGYNQEGPNNPNYGRTKVETSECEICGSTFEYYPSDKKGLYCPECVENEEWREVPKPPKGEEHRWWKGGKIVVQCDTCGDPIRRWPNKVYERNFCEEDCQAEWFSEAYTGEGHPNWAGGGNRNYGPGWRRAKLETLERDAFRCVLCGTTRDDLERNPDVHHVIPVRLFDESPDHDRSDAHFPANLISLCVTCHRRADHGRIPPRLLWDAIDVEVSLADDRFPDAAIDEVVRTEFTAAD